MRTLLFLFLLSAGYSFAQDPATIAGQICRAKPSLIGLGESVHNDDGQHLYKLALLEEIQKQDTVNALFFESPFTDAVLALLEHKPYSYFVYPFWKTKALYPGLSGFIEKHRIIAAGIDPQENCSFRYFNRYLLEQGYISNAVQAIAQRTDSLLGLAIAGQPGARTRALSTTEAGQLAALQDTLISELQRVHKDPAHTSLLVRCLENRKYLARLLSYTHAADKMRLREEVMAANLHFLDQYFPAGEQGVQIVWAANRHIAIRNAFGTGKEPGKIQGMMELYAASAKQGIYSVGIAPAGAPTGDSSFDLVAVSGKKIPVSAAEFNDYDCRP